MKTFSTSTQKAVFIKGICIFSLISLFNQALVCAQDNWRNPMITNCTRPIVLLKADDLGKYINSRWRRYIHIIETKHICTSIGLISNEVTGGGQDEYDSINSLSNLMYTDTLNESVKRIEFWNHSSEHVGFADQENHPERTEQWQENNITTCQDFFEEELGFQSHAFGAPGNGINQDTKTAVDSYNSLHGNQIGVWMGDFGSVTMTGQYPDWNSLEAFTYGSDYSHLTLTLKYTDDSVLVDSGGHVIQEFHIMNYTRFLAVYEQTPTVYLFQLHPAEYASKHFIALEHVIDYLKDSLHALFVTPSYIYDKANTERYCGDYYDSSNVAAINSLSAGYSARRLCENDTTAECHHVTVHDGANVTFSASRNIHLLPGFTSQNGSAFHALIDNGGGSGGRKQTAAKVSYQSETPRSKAILYPNPNEGNFIIDLRDKAVTDFSVRICNTQGEKVLEMNAASNQETVDLSGYPNGVYIVHISSGKGVNTYKIIKK